MAILRLAVRLTLLGVALSMVPGASASTAAQRVGAKFRHVALHRLETATGQPAERIHTACYRSGKGWRCAAVAFDSFGLVANVGRFRFTWAHGSSGYYGPKGKRWIMRLRGHGRHLAGHLYFWSIGQPMDQPAQVAYAVLPPWRNCC